MNGNNTSGENMFQLKMSIVHSICIFFKMQYKIVTCIPITATSMTKLKLASGIRSIINSCILLHHGKKKGEKNNALVFWSHLFC